MDIRDRCGILFVVVCAFGLVVVGAGLMQEAQSAKRGHHMTTQVDQPGERNEYNFVADGSFENVVSEWVSDPDGTGPQWVVKHDITYARSGAGYAERVGQAATQRRLLNDRVFDVTPEGRLFLEAWLAASSALFRVGVIFYDSDGVEVDDPAIEFLSTNHYAGNIGIPFSAVRAQVYVESLSATVRVDDVFAAEYPSHLAPLGQASPQGSNNVSSTRTNANYGDLAGAADSPFVDFVAPPNGRVLVTVSALMRTSAAGSKALMGYQIIDNTDSSVFQDATTERSAATEVANLLTATRPSEVTDLVPGRSYRARAKYRSTGAATITAEDRRIIVQPALGVS